MRINGENSATYPADIDNLSLTDVCVLNGKLSFT